MALVAISGAHGTGKSTLIKALTERIDIVCVGNVMRGIAHDGFGVGPWATPETIAEYLRRQAVSESQNDLHLRNGPIVVSDRCAADGLAYVEANAETGVGVEWSQADRGWLSRIAHDDVARFSSVFVCVPDFPLDADHWLSSLGGSYRLEVHSSLVRFLQGCSTEYYLLQGPLERRIDTVLSWVRSANSGENDQ